MIEISSVGQISGLDHAVISGPVPPGINCISTNKSKARLNKISSALFTLYFSSLCFTPQCSAAQHDEETRERDDEGGDKVKMTRRGKSGLTIAIELPFKSVFPSGVATVPDDVT
jgi:hypothetical protein